MSLIDLINSNNNSVTTDDNGPWRQFVLDHLDYIKSMSALFSVPGDMMNLYRYDISRFLKEQSHRHEDLGWIVLLINDLNSEFDFYNPGTFAIPTDKFIKQMYLSYSTTSQLNN